MARPTSGGVGLINAVIRVYTVKRAASSDIDVMARIDVCGRNTARKHAAGLAIVLSVTVR